MLADLVRGAGGGAFAGGTGGKRKGKAKATASSKEKVDLDLNDIAGGKITMNKAVSYFLMSFRGLSYLLSLTGR
jgi:ATP-dependent DNA helicase Q1